MSFDRDELAEMGQQVRKATRELDARHARILVLDFVVGLLVIGRFGGLVGFGLLVGGSFVLGLVCEVWADVRGAARERKAST